MYGTLALLALAALTIRHTLQPFLLLLIRQARSPLKNLRGPPSSSFFLGNLAEMHDQENTNLVPRWTASYGSAFVYRGFIGGCRLMLTDERAVAHVLGNAYQYPKPDFVRDSLATMAAGHEGLLTVEDETHRRQRKIINPAFSSSSIKAVTPIFWDKAIQLRDIWATLASEPQELTSAPHVSPRKRPRTDVLVWLTRATLDVIGLAGFGYTFDALASAAPSTSPQHHPFLASREEMRARPRRRFTRAASEEEHFPPSQPFSPLSATFSRSPKSPKSPKSAHSTSRRAITIHSPRLPTDKEALAESPDAACRDSQPAEEGEEVHENELARAFSIIFSTARKFRAITILQAWFPFLRRFKRNSAAIQEAHAILDRIGNELIQERTMAVEAEKRAAAGPATHPASSGSHRDPAAESSGVEGDKTRGRDLLSVLIRSNLAESPEQRLSRQEVLCQISTFIAAGHETTSNALSWTLYALARDLRVQSRLRAELRTVRLTADSTPASPTTPSSARLGPHLPPLSPSLTTEILALPYLDGVVRESLRLHAPISSTMRVCAADDVIPVLEPFVDKHGRTKTAIEVKKHDIVSIPIQAINRSERTWGPDAGEFRPERWDDVPDAAKAVPGLYAHLLTFLNGNPLNGNRACIGWKFALTEIKVFLYVLLRDLEFSIDPAMVIEKKVKSVAPSSLHSAGSLIGLRFLPRAIVSMRIRSTSDFCSVMKPYGCIAVRPFLHSSLSNTNSVVTRPFVKSEPELGNQMPLNIRRVSP